MLPAETVARKPDEVTHVEAAALPLAGTAAFTAVDAIDPKAGDVVFVSGASGGVGSYALQMLKARGCLVVATGAAADVERLTALGADSTIDHEAGSVEEQIRANHPDGVAALIDLWFQPQGPATLSLVKKGGKVASLLNALTDDTLATTGLTGTNVWASPAR